MTAVKQCTKCGVVKDRSCFYSKGAACRVCTCAAVKTYAAKNKERMAANNRRWKIENRERVLAIKKKWRDSNKEFAEQLIRDWCKRNPHKTREVCARRYAAKTKATPAWADKDAIRAVYAAAVAAGLHVDHIVPLRSPLVCGLHVAANLRLISQSENRKKGNYFWPDMP